MPNIKPVSDLRNYNEVLKDAAAGKSVFKKKDGRGKLTIPEIEEYEKNQATIQLLSKLLEAEKRIKSGDKWLTDEQVKRNLGVHAVGGGRS
ncbi:prevent-host-death protein [Bacillus norwichensis]|uniref:Prevent-host-death protein n=1 Tax=Bacillus norwichensis TaxID=2762217 RepID=A0ABR8VKX6_9BACI|nr:prevent-host-death protein [Bacillus norwichensis]MBD8005404.1 prevent-host-death protein [Bacillus norwichensis]